MGMNGTQHLLKSIGIDPAQIMEGIESFKNLAVEVKARQERVEAMLLQIADDQVRILAALDSLPIDGERRTGSDVGDVLDALANGFDGDSRAKTLALQGAAI
jgi:hypothetical protein